MTDRESREAPKPPREITSAELFSTGRELIILHNGERYCLRLTANNKLILTK